MPRTRKSTTRKGAKPRAASSSARPLPLRIDRTFGRFGNTSTNHYTQMTYAAPTLRRTLRYSAGGTITTGAGAVAFSYWRAIGAFDPQFAVGGHQPMGFDQIMALYSKFNVLNSRITIRPYNNAGVPTAFGVHLTPGSSASIYSDYAAIDESGLAVWQMLPAGLDIPVKIVLSQNTSETFGNVNILDDDELAGSGAADPVALCNFAIYAQDVNSTSVAIVQFTISLEYDILFTEPKQVAQS